MIIRPIVDVINRIHANSATFASHPPHRDHAAWCRFVAPPDLRFPRHVAAAVEDDEVGLIGSHPVAVLGGLQQAVGNRLLGRGVAQLQFNHGALHTARRRTARRRGAACRAP
jgi:hypothetical protein